jgi:hypothetical protein
MPFWPIYLPDGRPITVRPNSEGFELIAGARRYRAEQLAELFSIPARIFGCDRLGSPVRNRRVVVDAACELVETRTVTLAVARVNT